MAKTAKGPAGKGISLFGTPEMALKSLRKLAKAHEEVLKGPPCLSGPFRSLREPLEGINTRVGRYRS